MSTTPTDPRAQLADAIARLTDDQVYGLMKMVGVDMAVEGVFLEMQRRFLPQNAEGGEMLVQWDMTAPEDEAVVYAMRISPAGITWSKGAPDAPSLIVGCTVIDFMRLMIGQLDSTEAFMTGRLRVSGDLQLVQQLGTWFDLS